MWNKQVSSALEKVHDKHFLIAILFGSLRETETWG